MADRLIQRNDTAARWQSINPILATGEIGIEIDGAKGYKIGDGKTRWNDLPYPANPTNVVQELGNNENAVPSQKLVTEKLSELGSELVTEIDVPYDEKLSGRYIKSDGEIGNYDYFYVNLYDVVEGDRFQISFPDAGLTIAYEYAIYSSSELNQNNAIEVGNAVKSAYSIMITIPKGGVVLAVNSQIGENYATIKKIEKVYNKLNELKDNVSKIENDLILGITEVTSDFGNFIFDSTPEKSISTIQSKKINKDGSLADYEYDRIDVYPVQEGVLYRVKGQTITGGIYAFAFYNSDMPSSDTLVEIGEYVSTGGVLGEFDFFKKAPLGATHIAISRYKRPYTNYDSPLALYNGVYSAELKNDINLLKPVKREVENLNSAVFTKVAKPVESEYIAGTKLNGNGNITSDDLYGIYKVNVAPGEEYHFYRNYDIGSTGSMTYALYSSEDANSNTVVEVGPEFDDPIDLTIKIPDGVVLMIVGKVTSYDTQVTRLELVSRLETQENSIPNFAVQVVSEEEISVTRRYSETEDLRVTFKKGGANKLMAIFSHSFVDNIGKLPSFNPASVTKQSYTDWIGPYVIKANNREGTYTGFTGGWHGYNGDQTGAKTADTVDVRMLIDNRKAEIGNYYCNDVKIIVTNLIQAGNTKAVDGNGINVLREVVTYHFSGTKIFVSVVMTALEDISFNTYYGMQVTNYSQSIRYFADNVVYKEWNAEANRTDKKNLQFIICKGTDGRYVKAAMDIVGLGAKEYSNPSSIAFVSESKAYYSLASSDWNKTLTLVQGEQAYWKGYYEFIPAEFTDSCIL